MVSRRNTLPRLSSPKGIDARAERRLLAHGRISQLGKVSPKAYHKPGSRNPRKVGR